MNDELPKGWVWTSLEKCIEVLDNQRNPINAEEREKRINDKDQSKLFPYYGATGQVGWIDDYIFDEELILLGEDGAPFLDFSKDKAYLIRGRSWVNNHAHVLRAIKDISVNSFICHYLNTFDYHNYITGTTRYKLNQSQMRKIMIPVPPLAEQQRIVNKIEELFTNLDKGVESLNLVKYKLKIYRQAILKYAMEGKLTEKWREENEAKLKTVLIIFEQLEVEETSWLDGKLLIPKEWKWTKLEKIISNISNGITEKQNKEKIGFPVTRIETISNENINMTRVGYLKNLNDLQIDKYRLKIGDILFSNINSDSHLGKTAVFEIENQLLLHGMNLLLIRPLNKYISSQFLNYLFMFYRYSGIFISIAQHAVNQSSINQSKLKNLDIPLPPLEEQNIIVEQIEQLFSLANYIEETVDSKLEQSKKLRQSILKKAFEGKLVPQDPNDEPAEILLERIKIEKSNKGKAIQEK
ncbi:MAG: restriction endonuclease subunit S [Methanofastidiosum sp.]